MGAVWSDERRFTRWLDVEIAAIAGWAELGVVPADAVSAVREPARVDVARIGEIEDRTHHDVLAFTESVAEQVGGRGRWFITASRRPTSSTRRWRSRLGDAGRILLEGFNAVDVVPPRTRRGAPAYADDRPHARRARRADRAFGLKLFGWLCELRRGRVRL